MQRFAEHNWGLIPSVGTALFSVTETVQQLKYSCMMEPAFGFVTSAYQKDNLNNGQVTPLRRSWLIPTN